MARGSEAAGAASGVGAASGARGAAALVERLLARGRRALDLDGDLRASRGWFEQAYRVAERSGDAHTLATAALGLAGLWVHEYRTTAASQRLHRTADRFLDADPHAERSLGELRETLAQREHLAVGFAVSAIDVMLAIRAGRLDEAEALTGECAERGAAAGDIDTEGWRGAIGHWPAVTMSRQRYAEALAQCPRPAETAAGEAMECRREGRSWRVALGSRSVLVEHRIGLLHLAVLIANPKQEIPAIDLVAGVEAVVKDSGSAQPVLDQTAIGEYRRRLSRLRTEIDELAARGDTRRTAAARAERDWLIAELSGASGLGDRVRHFADDPERARIAVGKAIRRAIDRIAAADAVIGENLRGRVRTGVRCSYWPA